MPEAAVLKPNPTQPEKPGEASKETWIKYNDQDQIDFQQSVKNKLAQAGIQHDPVPAFENGTPIQVPDGRTRMTIEKEDGDFEVPDSHKPDAMVDNISHFVNFTGGDSGASARVDKAAKIIDFQEAKKAKVQNYRNQGTQVGNQEPSGFIGWLHKPWKRIA